MGESSLKKKIMKKNIVLDSKKVLFENSFITC